MFGHLEIPPEVRSVLDRHNEPGEDLATALFTGCDELTADVVDDVAHWARSEAVGVWDVTEEWCDTISNALEEAARKMRSR